MSLIRERWAINKSTSGIERCFTMPNPNEFKKFIKSDQVVESGSSSHGIHVLRPKFSKKEEAQQRRAPVEEYGEENSRQEVIRRSARLQQNAN